MLTRAKPTSPGTARSHTGGMTDLIPPDLGAELVGRVVVGVGTDLVDVDEIRTALARQPRFAERVFTAGEREYCEIPDDPAERYAVRWAAKEAVLKALGEGLAGARLTDIEVVREPNGRPGLVLGGRALARAEAAGIGEWLLTMSHSRTLAHAFVAGLARPNQKGHAPRI